MKGYNNTEQHCSDHLNEYFIKYKQIIIKNNIFQSNLKAPNLKLKFHFRFKFRYH